MRLLMVICGVVVLAWVSGAEGGGFDEARLGWGRALSSSMVGEWEWDMLDMDRRILASSSYISYGALQRNTVPCSRRGASYYNCQTGASSNPYSRGCSTITRCRT